MTVRIVRLEDCPPKPWKNGGGLTHDLLAWPAPEDWQCRLSVAEVARAGPFSAYPGVQRWFAVVQGAGVRLAFGPREQRLTVESEPLVFDGGQPPGCELLGGPTLDLNLMVQQARGSGHVERALPGRPWASAAPLRGLFSARPAELVADGRLVATLPAMSLAWSETAAGRAWTLAQPAAGGGSALAWWWSFTPAG